MQHPVAKKQIQTLTGKLSALNRFISRYSVRSFFAARKEAPSKGWGPECDKAFHAKKQYVASLLSLSQSVNGEDLYLYLAASATTMSAALVRSTEDGKQKPVYFVSKVLIDTETRYADFE